MIRVDLYTISPRYPRSTQPGHSSVGRHMSISYNWGVNRHSGQCKLVPG